MSTAGGQRSVRRRRRTARVHLLAWGLATVGVLLLGAVAVAELRPPPDIRDSSPTIDVPGADRPLTMTWLGDTLLGDRAQDLLDANGYAWVGSRLDAMEADVVIANLEGPITTRTEPADPTRRWSYNARPAAAAALSTLGVDAVGLANNHAMDRGPVGLNDTIDHARAAGLATFGAGADYAAARRPLFVDADVGTVAVVGFADTAGSAAASNRAGVRTLSEASIDEAHTTARDSGATWVVAYVHWGSGYAPVTAAQRTWATALVQAGFDLVVGHGAHVVQPIEWIDDTPVVFSVGNWVFGTPGRFTDEATGRGMVLTTTFDGAGGVDLAIDCIETDNKVVDYQPRPCPVSDARPLVVAGDPAVRVAGDGRVWCTCVDLGV